MALYRTLLLHATMSSMIVLVTAGSASAQRTRDAATGDRAVTNALGGDAGALRASSSDAGSTTVDDAGDAHDAGEASNGDASVEPDAGPADAASLTQIADAAVAAATPETLPELRHAPLARAMVRVEVPVTAEVLNEHRLRVVECHYRYDSTGPWQNAILLRQANQQWGVSLAAPELRNRTLEYYIDLVSRDGTRTHAFASPEHPHLAYVGMTAEDAAEARRLADHRGTRSQILIHGGYFDFGWGRAEGTSPCGSPQIRDGMPFCPDWYYAVEASYRYHFFRTIRSVHFGAGHMRGSTTVQVIGSWVGLDYGYGDVEFQLAPPLTLSARLVLGATATTVQPGAGFGFNIDVSHAARVSFAYQGVLGVGHLITGWMRWLTVPDMPMGAGVEITNYPAANGMWAVRLTGEVGRRFGRHFTATVRGGYEARRLDAGGLTLGGTLAFQF